MDKETILVVDDEPAILQVLQERLEREGFVVRTADNGEEAMASLEAGAPDLIILDLMLPGMDGFDVLRAVRQAGHQVPVIVLTARDDQVDVIVGLELGADDYIVKPFNPRELAARVRAVLRRRAEALSLAQRVATLEARLTATSEEQAQAHERPATGLHFDHQARRAWYSGDLLDLRPREYDLLYFLAQHAGQVFTRSALLDRVWGEAEYIDDRTVDVHIHRLRQKLAQLNPGADPIQTERGIGYRFEL